MHVFITVSLFIKKNITVLCGADISAGAFHKYYEIAAIPLWHKNTAGDCYKNLRTENTLSSLEKWFLRRLVGGLGGFEAISLK